MLGAGQGKVSCSTVSLCVCLTLTLYLLFVYCWLSSHTHTHTHTHTRQFACSSHREPPSIGPYPLNKVCRKIYVVCVSLLRECSFAVRDKWDEVCDWTRVTHHKTGAGIIQYTAFATGMHYAFPLSTVLCPIFYLSYVFAKINTVHHTSESAYVCVHSHSPVLVLLHCL